MFERRPTKDEKKRILSNKLALVATKDFERILIGTEENIKKRLDGECNAEIAFDEIRPFGSLLLTMDTDPESEWPSIINHLKQAQKSLHASNVRKAQKYLQEQLPGQTKPEHAPTHEGWAQDVLIRKFNSGDPICRFVAARIWYGYWVYREEKAPDNCEFFLNSMHNLVRPFSCYRGSADEQVLVRADNPIFRHTKEAKSYDREQIIYTASGSPQQECIIVDRSLIPLEKYYLSKFDKWKKYIIRCKICDRQFMADSLRYQLCSVECKEQARLDNLAERKKDETTSSVDCICKAASAHWYNRLSRIKESNEWSATSIQEFENHKNRFLKEKIKMRKAHKKGEITFEELRDWLLHQEVEAQAVLESLMVTKR